MPGTTRYSATFDCPYEEEEAVSEPPNGSRRSRSQSWQANTGGDTRPCLALGQLRTLQQRSSSTDSGTEHIPTRTVSKTVVKTHNNPFQFVKVGSCPLYKKAEEQLKKVKEVKKPDVLKEEEEWQSNLDSWKSRRRKMSEDVFRRQEEIKQFEQEEQSSQIGQKKIKTFSEMVESRANRGRTLSLCLISSPLELQEWNVQTYKSSSSHPFSEGSEENSAVNSEDEGVGEKKTFQKNLWPNGNDGNSLKNSSTNECKSKVNEPSYADSGLESISSGHRMGDTPDSCSDFSQDSGSSIDCDSPRVSGLLLNSMNILEDYNSKSTLKSNCQESNMNSKKINEVFLEKETNFKSAPVQNDKAECSVLEIQYGTDSSIISSCMDVLSDTKVSESNIDSLEPKSSFNDENKSNEKSIESENEVFVDDFEELKTQSKVFCPKAQQISNAIPSLKSMPVLSVSLKSSSNAEKSSCNSKKSSGVLRKYGINCLQMNEDAEKSNCASGKSNISYNTKKLGTSNVTENLNSSNDTEKSSVSYDLTKSTAVNCKNKSNICKGTKNLNPQINREILKSTKNEDKSSINCEPAKSSCMEESVSKNSNKLKTTIAKEISQMYPDTQESTSFNNSQNLKHGCYAEKLNKEKPKNADKFKTNQCSEKSNNISNTGQNSNSDIEKSNQIKAEKSNYNSPMGENIEYEKEIFVSDSQNKVEISVAVDEKKQRINSDECETRKPKNVIRRKKKKATAKIVSVEIANEEMSLPGCQKEEILSSPHVSEESLNIVFHSEFPKIQDFSNIVKTCTPNDTEKMTLNDVLPVEKVAEQMEKLILQQLEEEERAKEMFSKMPTPDLLESPEHNLTAPPRRVEPPKEKPPPPPVVEHETPKTTPLKRVNSTKRIKKEIHKRMSNFLGIEADDNGVCDESSVPPPPALDQILKVELELEKESRKRLESASEERFRLEETEIMEKEQEIIANLETEESLRQLLNNAEICDFMQDEDRIQKLKEERKKMENERVLAETQRLRLEEEKQLREREKFIQQQEANNAPSAQISTTVLSDADNHSNNAKSSHASSLYLDTKPNVSLSCIGGEGKTVSNHASRPVDLKKSENLVPVKPEIPPKPLKKKEAIRKERERLRQEQEALQREREEHRLKLCKEQDELLKNNPKPYASNASAIRSGPIPFLKPAYNPQLTNRIGPQPSTRENVIYTSQSYQNAQNGISGNNNSVELVLNKQSKPVCSSKKAVQNDAWVQQKMSPVKKQSPESSPESKYNQNHWLIQEAEMRRIAELKERQHSTHYPIPQTHLAEDNVCSTPPAMLLNSPLHEKMWSYGHSTKLVKNYLPLNTEKPVGLPPQPPAKPSRVVPVERPEHMLSVSGRKRCSHCNEELGRGAAMIIESLQLYYHIHCFQCCVCQAQLGNGSCGTDVRVRNNKLHCQNCYSNDEAGLKFSQV